MLPEDLLACGSVIEAENDSCRVRLYVQPRASRISLCGIHDTFIKLRITAPPVDNKANTMIIAYLAKKLKVAKSQVSLVSGMQSRQKTMSIQGMGAQKAATALAALME